MASSQRHRHRKWAPKRQAAGAGEDDVSGGGEHDVSAGHNERMAWQATHWREFRRLYPIRASSGIEHTDQGRPARNFQHAWHEYSTFQTRPGRGRKQLQQQWLMAPFSVPTGRASRLYTNPVPVTDPFQYQSLTGEVLEHYTNICRIEALAAEHPIVESVSQYTIDKSSVKSVFDAT